MDATQMEEILEILESGDKLYINVEDLNIYMPKIDQRRVVELY